MANTAMPIWGNDSTYNLNTNLI
eukprot:SAG31_NODE_19600_length_597_cov_1.130522_1_plen_22_part_10